MKHLKNDTKQPSPEEIKQTRIDAGLTQTEAASLVHAQIRAWQRWESGERTISLDAWELFLMKVKEMKEDIFTHSASIHVLNSLPDTVKRLSDPIEVSTVDGSQVSILAFLPDDNEFFFKLFGVFEKVPEKLVVWDLHGKHPFGTMQVLNTNLTKQTTGNIFQELLDKKYIRGHSNRRKVEESTDHKTN